MLKLYKLTEEQKEYWETWKIDDKTHIIHWGLLGTKGEIKTLKSTFLKKPEKEIQKEIDTKLKDGFKNIELDDHFRLLIEYKVDEMGNTEDVDKRHRLEDRMNQLLGWTGLGACDGGSIGSGTMEVCNYVVDFELARQIIETDLAGSEFENYTRIYDENSN